MARRSSISEIAQIRLEATPGTDPGTGTKRFKSAMLTLKPEANVIGFRGSASKYKSVVSVGKEWSSLALTGVPTYDELPYFLASAITTPVITTPGGGTNSRLHTFTPSVSNPDTPKTFTIERGQTVAAEKASYCIVNEFAVNVNRNETAMTGALFGQLYQTGITLAGSPTVLPLKPVFPKDFQLFVDTTFGGMGTTLYTADFVANFTITGRYGQVWPINSAKTSYDEHVETEPQVRLALQVENNTTGQAFITAMRAGSVKYVRLKATTTDFIEGAIPWLFGLDFVGVVIEAPAPGETDGLVVLDVVLEAFDNGTNPPYVVTVQNTLVAL